MLVETQAPQYPETAQAAIANLLDERALEAENDRLTQQIVSDPALAEYELKNEDMLALTKKGYQVQREQEIRILDEISKIEAEKQALGPEVRHKYEDIWQRRHYLSEGSRLIKDDEPEARPLLFALEDALEHSQSKEHAPFADFKENTPEVWKNVPNSAVKDYFADRLFVDPSKFAASGGSVVIKPSEGGTLEVPSDIFVHLTALDSWMGRGREGRAGKRFYSEYHQENIDPNRGTSSIEAIKHYASLPSELPPVTNVNIYVQPDGTLFADNGNGDSHRVAAAIVRGEKGIKAETVTFRLLKNNELANIGGNLEPKAQAA